jgi:hypothetical protein
MSPGSRFSQSDFILHSGRRDRIAGYHPEQWKGVRTRPCERGTARPPAVRRPRTSTPARTRCSAGFARRRQGRHDGPSEDGAAPAAPSSPAPPGSFEFRARSLLTLGRQVDQAFAAYQPAREALEEAWRRWQEAIVHCATVRPKTAPGSVACATRETAVAAMAMLLERLERSPASAAGSRPNRDSATFVPGEAVRRSRPGLP